tara:strand:- start:2364 stop:2768 length:405 start_codon:yes stop_codon:yes gene_type:complete
MKTMTIGGLSERTGVHIETIRFYEKKEILPNAVRNRGGRRIYDESDVKRLNFVNKCRGFGFSLAEIMSLLSLVDTKEYTCRQVHDLTLEHAKEVNRKIVSLKQMELVLLNMADQCGLGNIPECPIIDSLFSTKL